MSSSDKGGLVKSSSSAGLVLAKDPLLLLKHKDKPKIAVEEEEFTETIGKIIRRDFFPELPKLEAQLAFIEATESNDHDKLREISERYPTHIKTPNATPSTFQTPLPSATPQIRKRPSEPGAEEGISKVPRPEDAPSLDSFLSTYQSEDDASFDGIMKLEEEKRLEKYAWMYEREQLAREMNTISPSLTSGDGPKPVQGAEAKAITDGNEAHKDGRGQIKMWDYTAKNTLMYIPDGASETTKELIRKKNDKIIRHGNTRLSSEFLRKMSAATGGGGSSQISVPESAKEKVGIDGKALHVNDSPQVNGYGFVATPQIRPGVDASPMMTWGTVEGTPLHISTDITPTPGPVFKIPKTPRRDALAHQLAEKASKSLREKKRIALEKTSQLLKSPLGRSPSGSSTVERLKLLSPAARKLVSSSPGTGIFKGTDRSLRASYTPTRSASASSRNFDTGSSKPIPKQHGNESLSSTSAIPHSLTDNLLDLRGDKERFSEGFMTAITGTAGVEASLYQPAVTPDMSRTAAEKSWEELRRESRQLENEIDAKLNSFSKLSSNYLHSSSEGGAGQISSNSGHLYETISIEIEQLINRLRSVNEQMNQCMSRGQGGAATPTAALHHTLQRHNEILQDYMQEYNRTKNVILTQRQREELLGPRKTDGYKTSSALNRRTELYLKEHEHIRGSDALADEAISIAMTTKENLSHQRGAFSGITTRMQSVTHRFPLINSVVQKINLRKRRDSLIVGAVIAICLVILLFLIVR